MNPIVLIIVLLLVGFFAAWAMFYWIFSGGPERLFAAMKRFYRHLRLWRRLQDMTWLSIAGRADKELRHVPQFKAFEFWVAHGWKAHEAGDYDAVEDALAQARTMFQRLSKEQQLKLHAGAARARQHELMMMTADKCQ